MREKETEVLLLVIPSHRARVISKEKGKEHSMATVITVVSQDIQPSFARKQRSSTSSVKIMERRVIKLQIAEVQKGQEREDKRGKVMEFMR